MSRRKALLALICAAIAALSLGLAACGGDDDDSAANATTTAATTAATTPTAPATPTPTETTSTTSGGAAGAATALAVSADPSGALAFQQKTLTAKSGAIKITFTNPSPVPHNFEVDGSDVGSSDTVQDGGSASITVNLKPGTYEYFCAIPGHREAGMVGTLTVQ